MVHIDDGFVRFYFLHSFTSSCELVTATFSLLALAFEMLLLVDALGLVINRVAKTRSLVPVDK